MKHTLCGFPQEAKRCNKLWHSYHKEACICRQYKRISQGYCRPKVHGSCPRNKHTLSKKIRCWDTNTARCRKPGAASKLRRAMLSTGNSTYSCALLGFWRCANTTISGMHSKGRA